MKSTNIFYLLLIGLLCFGCNQNEQPAAVLFVCTHGAARSPIAAAYFNKMAEEQNLNNRAIFRGTESDEKLSDGTKDGLTNDGFNGENWLPQNVSKADIKNADKIVIFDCVLPAEFNASDVIQWDGTPSISKDYEKARDAIRNKVGALIKELSKT